MRIKSKKKEGTEVEISESTSREWQRSVRLAKENIREEKVEIRQEHQNTKERESEKIIEKQSVGECGPTIRTDTVN